MKLTILGCDFKVNLFAGRHPNTVSDTYSSSLVKWNLIFKKKSRKLAGLTKETDGVLCLVRNFFLFLYNNKSLDQDGFGLKSRADCKFFFYTIFLHF